MKKLVFLGLFVSLVIFANETNAQVTSSKSTNELITLTNTNLAFYKKANVIRPEWLAVKIDTSVTGVVTEYEYSVMDSSILMVYQKIIGKQKFVLLSVVISSNYIEIITNTMKDNPNNQIANMIRTFRNNYLNVTNFKATRSK